MKAHQICLAALLAGAILSTASCASPNPTPSSGAQNPAQNLARQAGQPTKPAIPLAARRAAIDRGADCSDDAEASGERAWLAAWCGLRAHEWGQTRRWAKTARSYYSAIGELRRQIEMGLMEASAADALGDRDAAGELAERAYRLWFDARMPIYGGLRDRFAGDLAYLYAIALERGLLDAPTTPDGRPLRRGALLEIARSEYEGFDRQAAVPYVRRAQARLAMERGDLGDAIARLRQALRADRRAERGRALRADLAIFDRLRRMVGDARRPAAGSPGVNKSGANTSGADRSTTNKPDLIRALLDTPAGRRQLADQIAAIRRSADRAIRPPPALVRTLAAYQKVDSWSADSWRLGFQGGQLLVERGRQQAATRYLRFAVAAVERMRASLPTPALRQRFFADKRPVYMALVDTYVGLDTANRTQADYRRGLRLANALKARGLLDLLDGRVDPKLATAEPADHWQAGGSVQRTADAALNRLDAWAKAARHTTAAPTRFADLPGALAGELGKKTAVLDYLITPRRSYVWVVTDDGIEMRRLAGREELAPLIDAFLVTFDARAGSATSKRQRKLAERLYVELIGPVEDVVKDVDRLIVAPDDKLYELPFEALARPRRSRKPHYLIFDRVVSYTPSSAVLARLLEREAPAASKPAASKPAASQKALVLGAPDLKRPAIDLLSLAEDLPESGMFSLDEMFPALPGARAELAHVQKRLQADHLDVDTLAGKKAAESWLRNADLTGYGIIHLATHGVSDAEPLAVDARASLAFDQPALLLSRDPDQPDDGIVTLGELLNRKTAARLVVLSGCTTGRGWRTLGAGAFGLAGAILYTGSQNVVASTWQVADKDTSKLMDAFYGALAAGKSPAQALRQGQIAMIKKERRPASWAAFRLIGN